MDSAVKSDSSGALGSAIVGTNQTAVLPSAGVDGISAIIFLLGTFRLRRIRCHGRRLTPYIVFLPTDSRRRRIMLLRQRCKRLPILGSDSGTSNSLPVLLSLTRTNMRQPPFGYKKEPPQC